jgi:DNA polymerase/3'-5' exonuclease PolX
MATFRAATKMSLSTARMVVNSLTEQLKLIGITEYHVAGSIRRQAEWIGDIDIIIIGDISLIAKIEGFEIKEQGKERINGIYKGQQVNFFRAEEAYLGAMKFYLTGPTNYQIAYRLKAKKKNWSLNQKGLFDNKGNLIAAKTEEDIYKAFDKEYKDPVKRGK